MKNVVFIKTDMKLEYGTKFTEVTKSKNYCSVVKGKKLFSVVKGKKLYSVVKGKNYSVVKHCIVEAMQ